METPKRMCEASLETYSTEISGTWLCCLASCVLDVVLFERSLALSSCQQSVLA